MDKLGYIPGDLVYIHGNLRIINNKWYLVENIVNRYKKLTNFTFTDVYVYLKELEEE
nr:MAG TPA: hypothetical protein [Caudoviricetes sp.]